MRAMGVRDDARSREPSLGGFPDSEGPTQPQRIRRPRLVARLRSGFDRACVVELLAGSGWGKTALAAEFAGEHGGAVTHLDLDLDGPDWIALGETLATLQEGHGEPRLLVLDNAERVRADPSAARMIGSFLAAPPTGVDVLLLTSTHLGELTGSLLLDGRCDVVTAEDLKVNASEAADLIELSGTNRGLSAESLIKLTDGWMAGVVLLARFGRSAGSGLSPVVVSTVEALVLGGIDSRERDLLMAGSLLGKLSRADAVGLLGADGSAAWQRLRRRGLPLLAEVDGEISYAPLLIECLEQVASPGDDERDATMFRRLMMLLGRQGRLDMAMALCIGRGELGLAVEALETALKPLRPSAEANELLLRWLPVIGESRIRASDYLACRYLRILHEQRRFDKAVEFLHDLEADDRMDDLVRLDPELVGVVLWTLYSRPHEAEPYLDGRVADARADAVRFMLSATSSSEPALAPMPTKWTGMAPVIHWGLLWQGRLEEILKAHYKDYGVDNPNVALAAVWSDQLDLAQSALLRIPEGRRERPQVIFVRAAMEVAYDRHAEALDLLGDGLEGADLVDMRTQYEVLAAFATIKAGEVSRAAEALEVELLRAEGRAPLAITEWARLILGVALLDLERPADARVVLAEAFTSMQAARRNLLLPAVARAFAEAELRLGNEAAAARALEPLALLASDAGSAYWTRETVLLCRDLQSSGLLTAGRPKAAQVKLADRLPQVVELRPFQDPAGLAIDGVESRVRRLKVIELVADLALHPQGVDRQQLQQRMFPETGRSRGGNHFRQIIYRLGELTAVRLERKDGSVVAWPSEVELRSTDQDLESVVKAARTPGDDPVQQMTDLRAALDLASGVYLPSSNLEWVEARRSELSVLYEEGATKLLWGAVEVGDVDMVRHYGALALELNPFSEELYILLMRAELLSGNRSACQAVYRRAHAALGELGLEPGPEMQRLAAGGVGAGGGRRGPHPGPGQTPARSPRLT
jgi:DNA-binding SARP family transcriptional activator